MMPGNPIAKRYAVKSMFLTIQGEATHAGARAVFIRFTGCNAWSGRVEDRGKGAAICAAWCDTDFVGTDGERGGKFTALEIGHTIGDLWGNHPGRMVVITGGEPGLQLDADLVTELRLRGFLVHVETNGSLPLPEVDWVTVSPKPPLPVVVKPNEIKVVYPAVHPCDFRSYGAPIWVQPQDGCEGSTQAAVEFCLRNSWARLSVQTQKVLGIP